jgi:DDE family transposase
MGATGLGSRLKAQLSKFSLTVSEGLTRPQRRFVHQMLYGIQATQDVKLSSISRSLQEKVPLIKTEDRLSRNLAAPALDVHLLQRLAEMGSPRVNSRTVLCLDLSDVRKEYAQKMEYLDLVRDGSSGELHQGYWLCEVTAAEVHGREIVPLFQKLYSAEAPDFQGENAELLGAVEWVETLVGGRGIWAIDRGGDRRHVLEALLEGGSRFVIRSTGKRTVIDRRHLKGTVAEVAGRCRLRFAAQVTHFQDGQQKIYQLHYGAEPIWLPGRKEKLLLVVVAGFGREPLMLITSFVARAQDSESLWWIVQIYLTRWKIEETFRFLKQTYNLEDLRVLSYRRLQNLVVLVAVAAYFATTFLGLKMKLRLLTEKLLIVAARFFGIPLFSFYALAEGIRKVLSQGSPPTCAPPPDAWPVQLLLAWHG